MIVKNIIDVTEMDYESVPVSIICFCGNKDTLLTPSDMKELSSLSTENTALINCRGRSYFPYDEENIGSISNEILKRKHMIF